MKVVCIYMPSLIEGCTRTNERGFGERMVTILEDRPAKGYWFVMRLTESELRAWRDDWGMPRMSYLP